MADLVRSMFPFSSLMRTWDDEDFDLVPFQSSGVTIAEDEKNVYVEVATPGVDPKDIEVTFNKSILYIRGEAHEQEADKKKKYFRRAAKAFSYRIAVPGEIDANAEPQAHSKHGVMTISFAKVPQAQPKKIAVKSA